MYVCVCMYENYKNMPWLSDKYIKVVGVGEVGDKWDLRRKTEKQFEIINFIFVTLGKIYKASIKYTQ